MLIRQIRLAASTFTTWSVPRGSAVSSRRNPVPGWLFPIIAGCLISGCSLRQSPVSPILESVVKVPDEFTGSEIAGPYEPLEWWKTFSDPVLDRVIQEALVSNFDLVEAVARVHQARSRARIANTPVFPSFQPSLSINDFNTPTNAGIGAQLEELGLGSTLEDVAGITLPDRLGLTTYNLSMELAYELDFWGRNRSNLLAAGAEERASQSDYLSVRMGVVAETVGTYLEIVNLRNQQRLASKVVEIFQEQESLARSRYDRGLTDVRAVHLARRSLRDAQAEIPQLEALQADAEGRLWVLLGGYRTDLAEMLPDSLTPSTALLPIPVGIPADLLVQRPDVNAARQRVEAAFYSVEVRRTDRMPRLSLQGSIGLQSTAAVDWFDPNQWIRNLGQNLLGPVFQGSQLRDQVALAEAELNEAAAAFGRSVVTAVNEVETALTGLEASRRRHALLSSLVEEAEAETDLLERRYVSGLGGYEDFLTAERILLNAQSLLASAERDLGYARLALHRALGGAWTANERDALQQSLPPDRPYFQPPTE